MGSELPITDVAEFNPSRQIKHGTVAPFVDMAALPEHQRDISHVAEREFTGGGSRFQNGDTLFARITPCLENGKTAKVSVLPDGIVAHGSTEFIVMAAKAPEYDDDYVYYLARHPEFRAFAEARMEGTSGRQRVSWQALSEFAFPFPSPDQRKIIGSVLRKMDNKIALNRRINQTLEAMAQAIFKSWFVDFEPVKAKITAIQEGRDPLRAVMSVISGISDAELDALKNQNHVGWVSPEQSGGRPTNNADDTIVADALGYTHRTQAGYRLTQPTEDAPSTYDQLAATAPLFPDEMVESELGEIPRGWTVKPLGEFLTIKRGGSPHPIQEFMAPSGLPWVKIADATAEASPFLFETREFIKELGLKKTVYLKSGALILTNSATPGLPKFLELDACIHDGWLYFPEKRLFTDQYLYFLFQKIRYALVAQGNGSVFTNLKTDILRGQRVLVPTHETMAVIELKNPANEQTDVWDAFNQLQTYKDEISDLFNSNEALVVSDGWTARVPVQCLATTSASMTFKMPSTMVPQCPFTTKAAWRSWMWTKPRSMRLTNKSKRWWKTKKTLPPAKKTKSKWATLEKLVGAEPRLAQVAKDLVEHFETRSAILDGKAMIVCMSRDICAQLYQAIVTLRPDWHDDDPEKGAIKVVMTGSAADKELMQPHLHSKQVKKRLEKRFKDAKDPLKLVIVRDMWLTGFDAPCCHTMYVDKPMKGHNLMQAIARVNRVFKNKPGALVVDYIGIANELKAALKTYTEAKGKGDPTHNATEALAVLLEKMDIVRGMMHGCGYGGFETKAAALLVPCANHLLGLKNGKQRFLDTMVAVAKAYSLCSTLDEAAGLRKEIAFFSAIKATISKFTQVDKKRSTEVKNSALKQILDNAIVADGIADIFALAGLDKPNIGLLSDEFLEDVRQMESRNLAVELLEKLLRDAIKARARNNVVQEKKYGDRLLETLRKYHNRAIETAQVIEELIQMAKEFQAVLEREAALGLGQDEIAFYDALANNESAVRELGDEILKKIAIEITEKLRASTTVDWQIRESVRARLRILVRRALQKWKYPPDQQAQAVELVLKQAEVLANEWSFI